MRYLIVFTIFIFSCSEKKEKTHVIFNNFDNFDGWGGISTTTLSKKQSFSKPYAIKIDRTEQYTIGFSKEMSKIFGGSLPSNIDVGAKIYRNSEKSKGFLCVEIFDGNTRKTEFSTKLKLDSLVTELEKWNDMKVKLQLPKNLQLHSTLKLYFMHDPMQEDITYADDFFLDTVESQTK